MIKRLLFFICCLFLAVVAKAQNLVPNPSFEIHDSCPNSYFDFSMVDSWKVVHHTPDYFNKCGAYQFFSIPMNDVGYQNSVGPNDSAYIGLANGLSPLTVYRELIGVFFTAPLQINQKYFVSFDISAASSNETEIWASYKFRCFCNNYGMRFFTNEVGVNDSLISNFANIFFNTLVDDTLNWIHFKSSFVADSAYSFLVIGNFFDSAHLNQYCLGSDFGSYVYLDNVCVSTDSSVCISTTEIPKIELVVNPIVHVRSGENIITIDINNLNIRSTVSVFNSLGQLLYSRISNSSDYNFQLVLAKGIYFLKIDSLVYKFIFI